MLDQTAIGAKRQQLLEDLEKWAKYHGGVPEGYKLVLDVQLRFESISRVEASIACNHPQVEFTRQKSVYLIRPLTEEEKDEIRSLCWSEPELSVVSRLLMDGEVSVSDLNKVLADYDKKFIYEIRNRIIVKLDQDASRFRLSYAPSASRTEGPYRFFRRK